jgi:hypothetical protein
LISTPRISSSIFSTKPLESAEIEASFGGEDRERREERRRRWMRN